MISCKQALIAYKQLQSGFIFKFVMMINTTIVYSLILDWMILTFIQRHSCMKKR